MLSRRIHVAHSPLLVVLLLVVSHTIGCGQKSTSEKKSNAETAQRSSAEESRRKLHTAIAKFNPQTMALQTRRESMTAGLNNWLVSTKDIDLASINLSDATSALLSPAAQRAATAMRFGESDSVYIRDCILMNRFSEQIWKEAEALSTDGNVDDRARVGLLFRRVIREVALLRTDEQRVPLGLFETLLTGRGLVDDRIWAFCESLRQRQMDSVLITASEPGDPTATNVVKAADRLIGVAVGKDVLLFDPARGTVVPADESAAVFAASPAGLSVLASEPRWQNATLQVTCHPVAFSPRMLVLQERLEADDAAGLFEELCGGTSEIRPLRDRLREVLGSLWPEANIAVWTVPEQRVAASLALNEDQKQQLGLLMREFDSPFERDSLSLNEIPDDPNVNEEELSAQERLQRKMVALQERWERANVSSDELFGKASRRLLAARVEQIMGNSEVGLIQDLQQIRIASLQEQIELEVPISDKQAEVRVIPLPEAIRTVQKSAVGDTLYWTSMCQMSRNDMAAAVSTLRNYRKQYPSEKFNFATMIHEAEALVSINDPQSAIKVLTEADVEANPDRVQAQWLLKKLQPQN